ncbi:SDR family oxidoreductase [Peribacillus cavernae]|uniref:SDR family oxidoreductase n=1 Tax=Peribacillus cavernae TaxID=1674310 RepID=A0A3S0U7N9_9BACI|nr:SDR family oxidoreductase [Peribacillus cavernae]MDQ0217925.1 3-oxoacyl-[acyl-carrier protein] reductase [Peribacillus cavernae]RUQ32577.1 SDR family oxidoreductase [Peribacillus cavernae]
MKEKIAMITGGATGIGRKTAIMLAQSGISIAVTYRKSKSEAEVLINELQKLYGVNCIAVQGDAADEAECIQAVGTVLHTFGKIDILIHNAGPYIHERKTMIEYTSEEWNYLISGNLNGFFYMAKQVIPYMRSQKWGRIVTFGFERSDTAPGWIYRSAFAAAKSGLTSLTKTLALEEAQNGITVNMVCPGDIIGEWKESSIDAANQQKDAAVPIGRPGTGEDLARVISFLCDEKSDFITGSVIPVTGGTDVLNKIHQE